MHKIKRKQNGIRPNKQLSKFGLLLRERAIYYDDAIQMIKSKTGAIYPKSKISLMCKKSYIANTETLKILAHTFGVTIDSLVEGWNPPTVICPNCGDEF